MNFPTKVCLGAGAFLVLSGGLLALTGFLMGGQTSLHIHSDTPEAAETPDAAASETLAPFAYLEVDVGRGDVAVVPGGDYGIELSGRLAEELNYALDGDTLTVTGGEGALESFSSGDQAAVTITVPEDAYLERVTLSTDMGRVEALGFTAVALDVSADLGSVDLTDVTAGEATLALSMGDLDTYGLTTRSSLTVTSDMGDVTLDGSFHGETSVTLSMGGLAITAAQPLSGCGLDLSAGLGDVYLNGELQSNPRRWEGNGDKITASSAMGDVSVHFME